PREAVLLAEPQEPDEQVVHHVGDARALPIELTVAHEIDRYLLPAGTLEHVGESGDPPVRAAHDRAGKAQEIVAVEAADREALLDDVLVGEPVVGDLAKLGQDGAKRIPLDDLEAGARALGVVDG